MLKKNVYILYRPGYSGSYVNWAINISDKDTHTETVKDPINRLASSRFGGKGTAHMHIRIPTHQRYERHKRWMLLNRPESPQVYILNEAGKSRDYAISDILQYDRDGICISINGGESWITAAYGFINGVLKWPTRIVVASDSLLFDPFDCAESLEARNWFIDHDSDMITGEPQIDYSKINLMIDDYYRWYRIRNQYQPHEINSNTYIDNISTLNRIFELSCVDVSTDIFVNKFESIMEKSGISDNYDFEFIRNFHKSYCQAQDNLQWFASVDHWIKTGNLDSYLLSHSAIEACIVNYIFRTLDLGNYHYDDAQWKLYYNKIKDVSWPDCDSIWEFYSLPTRVQDELRTEFNIVTRPKYERYLMELSKNWRSMSTIDINQYYQNYINQTL